MDTQKETIQIFVGSDLVTKEVTFNKFNLSQGDYVQLSALSDPQTYIKASINPKERDTTGAIDLEQWSIGTQKARAETIKILWGMRDVELSSIPYVEFQKLEKIAEESGVLAFLGASLQAISKKS